MFITIPLILNILAILIYRGVYRVVAMLILLPIGIVFLVDHDSLSQQGNLTGLLTILISGPLLVVLFLLGIANFVARRKSNRIGQSGTGVADSTIDNDQGRSARRRATKWEIAGAILAVCGMIISAVLGGIFRPSPLSIMTDLLLEPSRGYAVWLLGAALGVIAGGCLAWITGRKQRL